MTWFLIRKSLLYQTYLPCFKIVQKINNQQYHTSGSDYFHLGTEEHSSNNIVLPILDLDFIQTNQTFLHKLQFLIPKFMNDQTSLFIKVWA